MLLNIVANDWFEVGQFLIICVRQGFMSSTNKTHNVSGQSFLGKGLKMVAMFVLLYILILLCKMISNRVLVCSCIYVFRLQCFLVHQLFQGFFSKRKRSFKRKCSSNTSFVVWCCTEQVFAKLYFCETLKPYFDYSCGCHT